MGITAKLSTTDFESVCQEVGIVTEHGGEGKLHMICPWNKLHSDPATRPESGVSLLDGTDDNGRPTTQFKCHHSHCTERGMIDFIRYCETVKPGVVDRHSTESFPKSTFKPRATFEDKNDSGLVKVKLPGGSVVNADTAEACITTMAESEQFLQHSEALVLLEESDGHASIKPLSRVKGRLMLQKLFEFGREKTEKTKEGTETRWIPQGLSLEVTEDILTHATGRMPLLKRLLPVAIPHVIGNEWITPTKGFDKRLGTYLPADAPEIESMSPCEALSLLWDGPNALLATAEDGGPLWANEQSRTNAFARLITFYCRGIIGWDHRPPLFIATANRSRIGKEKLCSMAPLICDGIFFEGSPISAAGDEEFRKRADATMDSGSLWLHISNQKTTLESGAFECLTADHADFQGRVLGTPQMTPRRNEMEYSVTGNGMTITTDTQGRTLLSELEFHGERVEDHQFGIRNLKSHILANRSRLLSAIHSLVKAWWDAGRLPPSNHCHSFEAWGDVVPAIIEFHTGTTPKVGAYGQLVGGGGNPEASLIESIASALFDTYRDPDNLVRSKPIKQTTFMDWLRTDDYRDLENSTIFKTETEGGRNSLVQKLKKFYGQKLPSGFRVTREERGRGRYNIFVTWCGTGEPPPIKPPEKPARRQPDLSKLFVSLDSHESLPN
jgi:hypothetical protein